MGFGGFSWKRAVGLTKLKGKISRKTGIPLTKSGRQRKIGKMITGGRGGCLVTLLLATFICTAGYVAFGETEDTGKWQISRDHSSMDDSKRVVLGLPAENIISGYLQTYQPTLIIRCQENKTDLYVNIGVSPNPELGLYNQHTVRIRLDDGKPFSERWSQSTSGDTLFAPQPIALARKMVSANKMLFEFVPYNSNAQIAEFDIWGLKPYLTELSETCNWKISGSTKAGSSKSKTSRRYLSFDEAKKVGQEIGSEISGQYTDKSDVELYSICVEKLTSRNIYTEYAAIFMGECVDTYKKNTPKQ
ncbi:MAG TPA: type VI secretion system-associated protein TagO [Thermodesulfobacteriota bacterium]|nr:type VI secretion system-associated protein TagO [Thermodesulfobacteriota bacterium]